MRGSSLKGLALAVGWFFAVGGFYIGVVAIEFYWNMPDWHPVFDSIVAFLVAWSLAMIVAIGWLADRSIQGRLAMSVSFLFAVGLAALSLFLLPPEATSPGLLGRAMPSPSWYRYPRTILMLMPLALWMWNWRRKRRSLKAGSVERPPGNNSI